MIRLDEKVAERSNAIARLSIEDEMEYADAILAIAVAMTCVSDCFAREEAVRSTRLRSLHGLLDYVFSQTQEPTVPE